MHLLHGSGGTSQIRCVNGRFHGPIYGPPSALKRRAVRFHAALRPEELQAL